MWPCVVGTLGILVVSVQKAPVLPKDDSSSSEEDSGDEPEPPVSVKKVKTCILSICSPINMHPV